MGKRKILFNIENKRLGTVIKFLSDKIGIGDTCFEASLKNITATSKLYKKAINKYKDLPVEDRIERMREMTMKELEIKMDIIDGKLDTVKDSINKGQPKVDLCD